MDRYEGFREFVATRGPALLRTAYLLCGDHSAAQDLAQEALTKSARHWRRIRGSNPEAYVRKVMLNQHLAWWKRFRRHEYTVADVPDLPGRDDADSLPERLALRDALARLAPRQRAVIVLRYYEDMTAAETAMTLGVSTGTVKKQTFVALERLRSLLPGRNGVDELMEVTS